MKTLKKTLKYLLIFIAFLVVTLYVFDYDYMLKALRTIYFQGHTTAYLEDYKEFDNDTVQAGIRQAWPLHADYNTIEATETLTDWHERLGTTAFLVLKNDSIWYEKYFDGFDRNSRSNSFSVAKSMVSAMLGKAIMQGRIKSLDQPVGDFFPEFANGLGAELTVGDLSSMASGLKWDEAYYSPFSITTRAYFYDDLKSMMLGLEVVEQPGMSYKYLSGNTQLLGMVIEKATGQSLSEYLSESFWKPMGASADAFWQVDSEENNLEKAYCCLASNARDFARFGKLYKDHGRWNGEQLLDSAFVARSVRPRFTESPQYGYGWWLLNHLNKSFFMMRGHLGQYIIVQPEDNVIIVRLGHKNAKGPDPTVKFSDDIYAYIEEAYKMLSP
ncbi:MAG: serine hydrolase [Flavobacteriaceae bacterium]|nr:beta-lactamase family protein [Bacteroidia bacterium]NNK88337.1 serine hydrolase [Flavobacteriaceae bacterium]